ncbi:unnamed protein product [Cylicocyclus nassatus]|uniref:C2H2-type domain-containing protein n=1 Tax=Cylicocyclus nassatus TaxID=53992 RepID=A0AA36H3L5_CYLNA|nr:unnamed protein product [Cylicocyclus nassatus]
MFENHVNATAVRFVTVRSSGGIKRIRVNVTYERGFSSAPTPLDEKSWFTDAPPSLDLEGYVDEVPEWGGAEQEISSRVPKREDCGEQYRVIDEPSTSTSSRSWDKYNTEQLTLFASRDEKPESLKRKTTLALTFTGTDGLARVRGIFPESQSSQNSRSIAPNDANYAYRRQHEQGSRNHVQSERIAICRLCNIRVKSTLRRTHIYSDHLGKPMFKCPFCDVSSTYHQSNIRVHIKKIHNVTEEPICFKDQFEDDINSFLYRCFGDRQIFRRQDPEVIACLNDILNYVCDGVAVKFSVSDDFREFTRNSSRQLAGGVNNLSNSFVSPAFALSAQPRNTCRLCSETNVKHLERHVLQHHIKKPMYLCPYCDFSNCYSPASVKDHIKNRHSLCDLPIDLRDENSELIQSTFYLISPLNGYIMPVAVIRSDCIKGYCHLCIGNKL